VFKKERLWPYPQNLNVAGEFKKPVTISFAAGDLPDFCAEEFEQITGIKLSNAPEAYCIKFLLDQSCIHQQGYSLGISPENCIIKGNTSQGLFYGFQTLLQILAQCKSDMTWPIITIKDHPRYNKRCFMVDMGRTVYNITSLKRIVRILARLKMNQLHLSLYDDELCGLQFKNFPFGHDNPHSITLEELAELVDYASRYHVEIVPELESWGHVGSLVYHMPELNGGPGMYNGSCFRITEKTFTLMRELISQVVTVMPSKATIHLGLDEATWYPGTDLPAGFTPCDMVKRYYEILQSVGKEHDKELTLRIWADHGGRTVPEDIQHNVIIEPWEYWIQQAPAISEKIAKYSSQKMRWMMGAGSSGGHFRGAYSATRYWCQNAVNSDNVDGVNITMWLWNDLERRLALLFNGAYYAWNPLAKSDFSHLEDIEACDLKVFPIMYWWQSNFRDAFADDIERDRGPLVYNGFYLWGKNHGKAVAPTAIAANTTDGHDYLNEH